MLLAAIIQGIAAALQLRLYQPDQLEMEKGTLTRFCHLPVRTPLTAEVVLSTSTHIFTEIYNNPNFTPLQAPAPPVDQATLKSANDALASAIGAAVDGKAANSPARPSRGNLRSSAIAKHQARVG